MASSGRASPRVLPGVTGERLLPIWIVDGGDGRVCMELAPFRLFERGAWLLAAVLNLFRRGPLFAIALAKEARGGRSSSRSGASLAALDP